MAVGNYTYGTTDGVHRKIGWIVPSRAAFGSGTIPTLTQVEATLDQIAMDIIAHLTQAGYPVKTKTEMTAISSLVCDWLANLNEIGASAYHLNGFAIANDMATGNSPEKFWKDKYKEGLAFIDKGGLTNFGLTKSTELSDHLVCTSVLDSDGNEKSPLFTRRMFDIQQAVHPNTGEDDDA